MEDSHLFHPELLLNRHIFPCSWTSHSPSRMVYNDNCAPYTEMYAFNASTNSSGARPSMYWTNNKSPPFSPFCRLNFGTNRILATQSRLGHFLHLPSEQSVLHPFWTTKLLSIQNHVAPYFVPPLFHHIFPIHDEDLHTCSKNTEYISDFQELPQHFHLKWHCIDFLQGADARIWPFSLLI